MKSKIFSNKNIVTAFKSQSWLPLFIAVGFLFAFPVAELVMLGRWEHVNYTAGQMKILYANLWRDGFVLTGTIVAMASAFVNGASSFLYLYSRRKADFYHSLPVNRKQIFFTETFYRTCFLYYSLCDHGVSCCVHRSLQRLFQLGTYGNGSKNDGISFTGIFADLFLHRIYFKYDRKYPHGDFMLPGYCVLFPGTFLCSGNIWRCFFKKLLLYIAWYLGIFIDILFAAMRSRAFSGNIQKRRR